MTRIIAGRARGLRLEVPRAGTRPTSDRIRESLFAALEADDAIEGRRVLDLFAGSGALGLESLSRGAASADLVERSRPAAAVARRNGTAVARAVPEARIRVVERGVRAYLQRCTDQYDLVFVDPPYEIDEPEVAATVALLAGVVTADARIVLERPRRAQQPAVAPAGWEITRRRDYGDTTLWWASPAPHLVSPPDQPACESQSR